MEMFVIPCVLRVVLTIRFASMEFKPCFCFADMS